MPFSMADPRIIEPIDVLSIIDQRPNLLELKPSQFEAFIQNLFTTHVRDLWGTVQHEGALKGIMITTSGYGPDSYKFAAGKPLSLIDGTGLLALCQKHGIPARILNTGSH